MSLAGRVSAALDDRELARLGPGLALGFVIKGAGDDLRIRFADGKVTLDPTAPDDIVLSAASADWDKVLAAPPEPTFHAFTALDIANPRFTVSGDPLLIAQARASLERLFELICRSEVADAPVPARDISQIQGNYVSVPLAEGMADIFVESAGQGQNVLLLHTAGADSRQFHGQLADVDLARQYRLVAADMPFHGRSMPPAGWQGEPYRLTATRYLDWCIALIESQFTDKVVVAGGSMGAALALCLAAARPDLLKGIIAIEPPFRSTGRRNPYQHHTAVHAGLHNAAFVRGLMSPTSPLDARRRAAWIYSQGAPQVYSGDLAFYSDEFDGAEIGPRIDASQTPVALLCGTYDYSATPADGRKLADLIPGAMLRVMHGLGHFPMCENPDLFRGHFVAALDHVSRS
jgi:pimeloyl-ACP methyl ester carboxylesterase